MSESTITGTVRVEHEGFPGEDPAWVTAFLNAQAGTAAVTSACDAEKLVDDAEAIADAVMNKRTNRTLRRKKMLAEETANRKAAMDAAVAKVLAQKHYTCPDRDDCGRKSLTVDRVVSGTVYFTDGTNCDLGELDDCGIEPVVAEAPVPTTQLSPEG